MNAESVDPIAVADIVLDAALSADAESVRIEPASDRYLITLRRRGEVIAASTLATELATTVIARLGCVCNLEPGQATTSTGRTRVRSSEAERDAIMTVRPGHAPEAELLFVACSNAARDKLADLVVGEHVGHYRVLSLLGSGGMGKIYEVQHVTLGQRYALKVLQGRVIERDAEATERFMREAQAAARLRSPHIVDVFDYGYLRDGRPYFVMERLSGSSLADTLDDGALEAERALAIARRLAEALAVAHENGVIHSDVTPANVVLEDDGGLKLIDFGLATLREHATEEELRADFVTGTPSYLAPERIVGQPAQDASDQYAFGVVLFEMLAGHRPFVGASVQDVCLAHLRGPRPLVTSPYQALPPALVAIVARCIARHPADRFPSMRALVDVLWSVEVTS